ncbi:MAG: hypothetical protein IT303_17325 [Dehalococcoidia bacterium]|nr:hypothetical protein [Dehalococcoidia bacterium]
MRLRSADGLLVMLGLVGVAALAALGVAACSGDDDDDDTATPTTTVTTTATPGTATASSTAQASPAASPSPTATPTISPAQRLARSPQYVLYVAGEGDTLATVADAFDAQPGAPADAFVAAIRQGNQLSGDTLAKGQEVAVPLMLPGDLSLIPDSSLEAALGVGVEGQGGALVLLQPSLEMREGYLGKLILHEVALATGTPAGEGFGYTMEYWTTDRTVLKAGEVDPEARIAEAQFIVAAGSMAKALTSDRPGDLHTFTRDGVSYAVKLLARSPTAAQLAAMLETASER